jgi:hypothetical protein
MTVGVCTLDAMTTGAIPGGAGKFATGSMAAISDGAAGIAGIDTAAGIAGTDTATVGVGALSSVRIRTNALGLSPVDGTVLNSGGPIGVANPIDGCISGGGPFVGSIARGASFGRGSRINALVGSGNVGAGSDGSTSGGILSTGLGTVGNIGGGAGAGTPPPTCAGNGACTPPVWTMRVETSTSVPTTRSPAFAAGFFALIGRGSS